MQIWPKTLEPHIVGTSPEKMDLVNGIIRGGYEVVWLVISSNVYHCIDFWVLTIRPDCSAHGP